MNLLKVLFYVLVATLLVLFISGFKLSFKPFRIEFLTWYNLVGTICGIAAFAFFSIGIHLDGYKQGAEDMTKEIKAHLEKKVAERQANMDINK